MSNARTIAHYIKIAAQGRPLNSDCIAELESAIEGLVDDAVCSAVAKVTERLDKTDAAARYAANAASCLANGMQPD